MTNVLNKILPPDATGDNVYDLGGTVNMSGDVTISGSATITGDLTTSATSDITFVATAGAANVAEVAISVKDSSGDLITGVQNLKLWLSDSATGAGQTAVTASGTVTNKTASGTVLDTLTAKKSLIVQTLATGVFTLEITDTAKTAFYVCVQNPFTGKTVVSTVLATGDYGA